MPDRELLLEFITGSIIAYMANRLPGWFRSDFDTTKQAIRELLAEEDLTILPAQQVYIMARELIEDWHENQDV